MIQDVTFRLFAYDVTIFCTLVIFMGFLAFKMLNEFTKLIDWSKNKGGSK